MYSFTLINIRFLEDAITLSAAQRPQFGKLHYFRYIFLKISLISNITFDLRSKPPSYTVITFFSNPTVKGNMYVDGKLLQLFSIKTM